MTDAFIALAGAEANLFGLPELPMHVVPHHPWGAVTPEEWRADAERAVEGVARLLAQPQPLAP